MKYKIKVEVMQDGSSRYYPMVKKHWWSCWKYIHSQHTVLSNKEDVWSYPNIEPANIKIKEYNEAYLKTTIDHTYEIPYKEDEQ